MQPVAVPSCAHRTAVVVFTKSVTSISPCFSPCTGRWHTNSLQQQLSSSHAARVRCPRRLTASHRCGPVATCRWGLTATAALVYHRVEAPLLEPHLQPATSECRLGQLSSRHRMSALAVGPNGFDQCSHGPVSCASGLHSVVRRYCAAGPLRKSAHWPCLFFYSSE
jgi:hypothetical protein